MISYEKRQKVSRNQAQNLLLPSQCTCKPSGPLYTISKNKVLFQNLKSGAQTTGGSPPIKMNNQKVQYLAQDGTTIQKVAMAYGG
jgi:hypothetical protein